MKCVIDNNCSICNTKISHYDTMKYRDKINSMSTVEWHKWIRLCAKHKGTNMIPAHNSYAFIVRCLKRGVEI